ncbi:MAG: helix-hairpin-helix domain-containing protein [Acholeplasmatales bacterium]|nr:helix-hairpin-helix domain-containing protein [Acholeplasmatales bacterium]
MRRKKEIIIIILIVGITIFLAFMPMLLANRNSEIEENSTNNKSTINITVKGELKVEEVNIRIPYGYAYGYVITKIEAYLNKYSIVSSNKTKRYYDDSIIVIESSDTKKDYTEAIDTNDKIDINNANLDELIKLYGIGEKRAKAIIEYRDKKKIETFVELKELLGVSDEVINNIKEKAFL